MSGLVTRIKQEWARHSRESGAVAEALGDVQVRLHGTIRQVVERSDMLALDSKADREALIRDLVEALC